MTRQEFLDILGRALRRELSETEVMDNLRYYEDYIRRETAGGKAESEVLAGLGDPRLIARTILEVDEQKEEQQGSGYGQRRTVYSQNGESTYQKTVYTQDDNGNYQETVYTEDAAGDNWNGTGGNYESRFGKNVRVYKTGWKSWAILLLVIAVLFLLLGTVFAVLWKLLPVILILAGASWVYRRFFS